MARHRAGDLLVFLLDNIIQQKENYEMLSNLFVAGLVLFLSQVYCWDMVFPVKKKYGRAVMYCIQPGLAIMTLGTLIYLIEFKEEKAPGAFL